jgi:beta-1,4-N-acetylglucosaminyltransferase
MKLCLVCSHGGHLTEMLELITAFEGHELFFVTYQSERVKELMEHYPVYALRNIGVNPFLLLSSLPAAWSILRREQPHVVVSTGSEIALPFFMLAKLLSIRTVYIELCCRVTSPSRTGKLLYPIADTFLVQWPQLIDVYGAKARYEGGLL